MGAGVAGQIRKFYPNVYKEDCEKTICGDKEKMGTNLYVKVHKDGFALKEIVNMYCQYKTGRYIDENDYKWRIKSLFLCLRDVYYHYVNPCKIVNIGVPYLVGCGISGLKEEDVIQVFKNDFENNDKNIKITFVDFNGNLK